MSVFKEIKPQNVRHAIISNNYFLQEGKIVTVYTGEKETTPKFDVHKSDTQDFNVVPTDEDKNIVSYKNTSSDSFETGYAYIKSIDEYICAERVSAYTKSILVYDANLQTYTQLDELLQEKYLLSDVKIDKSKLRQRMRNIRENTDFLLPENISSDSVDNHR